MNNMVLHGCHNTARLPTLFVQDGWIDMPVGNQLARVPRMVEIKDNMSNACRYDWNDTDPRCEGCQKK